MRRLRTILLCLLYARAFVALAALGISTLALADSPVTVELSPAAAAELRSALANAPRPDPISALGLQGIADYETVVPVPMRDGVKLSATLILPRGTPRPWPAILIRSPYDPASEVSGHLASQLLPRLVRQGYAIVIVNDRGTQWSEGSYHWLKGANRDGWDILQWVSHQPWSTGRIGSFGCSSSGESQPPMATLNHPALRAMVAMGAGTGVGDVPAVRRR